MILLVSEVEDLQANLDRSAKGTIEAHLDKAKGPELQGSKWDFKILGCFG